MPEFQDAVTRTQAFRHFESGEFGRAGTLGEALLKSRPRDVQLLRMLGLAAFSIGRYQRAADFLRRALALERDDPALLRDLARVLHQQGRIDEAIAAYDRALKLRADDPHAVVGKAASLERAGRIAEAQALLQPHIDAGSESAEMAATFVRILHEEGKFSEVVALARRHLESGRVEPATRQHLLMAKARAHDRMGQYGKAFDAWSARHADASIGFDVDAWQNGIDQLIDVFSRANLSRLPRARNRSELPVFIASMPRSGSTLIEQIIHAHPRGFGAGETLAFHEIVCDLPARLDSFQPYPACLGDWTQAAADRLAQEYLRELEALARGKPTRIVNKHLENWRELGMVQLVLPAARIIHIRRDPMDTCFSCYTAALAPQNHPYASDLGNLGLVYRSYERLMRHWRETVDLPILDVVYEELVAEPEAQIRRIIDFCGLEWHDRCLRFHEAERVVMTLSYDQVRKPMYESAVGRWKHYAAFLGPLREALAEAEQR